MSDKPTRGERNNNPGNIDRNKIVWQGMAQDQSGDARFIVFESAEYGIRALAKLLMGYRKRGLSTVRKIVNTYAPPVENDTGAYVAAVAHECGLEPDGGVDFAVPGILATLVKAIIRHENGRVVYTDMVIAAGVARAQV